MLAQLQRRVLTLADGTDEIPQGAAVVCPGIHFCPDWDYLPICMDSPEWEACDCDKPITAPPEAQP